jgi:hypothetical protein
MAGVHVIAVAGVCCAKVVCDHPDEKQQKHLVVCILAHAMLFLFQGSSLC